MTLTKHAMRCGNGCDRWTVQQGNGGPILAGVGALMVVSAVQAAEASEGS